MYIKDIIQHLETIAPTALQESYDNSGLLVGDKNTPLTKVLVSLDCTEAIVQEAIDKGCNLIVSHHPIIFGGLKRLTGNNYIERTVIKAIQNNIALYAIHTNLDNVLEGGVNQKIAQKLGLENCKILSPKNETIYKLVTFCPTEYAENVRTAIFAAGAGTIGNYDQCSYNTEGVGTFRGNEGTNPFVGDIGERHSEKETRIETVFPAWLHSQVLAALLAAHPYEEVAYDVYPLKNKNTQIGSGIIGNLQTSLAANDFLDRVKNALQTPVIRYTAYGSDIKTVAVCGGSGSFLIGDAMAQNADVLLTADFKYHQFFDAEGRLMIADIGHYESEFYTIELLADILNKKFSNIAVLLTTVSTNPVKYHI